MTEARRHPDNIFLLFSLLLLNHNNGIRGIVSFVLRSLALEGKTSSLFIGSVTMSRCLFNSIHLRALICVAFLFYSPNLLNETIKLCCTSTQFKAKEKLYTEETEYWRCWWRIEGLFQTKCNFQLEDSGPVLQRLLVANSQRSAISNE